MKLWRNSYIFGYFVIDSKKKEEADIDGCISYNGETRTKTVYSRILKRQLF